MNTCFWTFWHNSTKNSRYAVNRRYAPDHWSDVIIFNYIYLFEAAKSNACKSEIVVIAICMKSLHINQMRHSCRVLQKSSKFNFLKLSYSIEFLIAFWCIKKAFNPRFPRHCLKLVILCLSYETKTVRNQLAIFTSRTLATFQPIYTRAPTELRSLRLCFSFALYSCYSLKPS